MYMKVVSTGPALGKHSDQCWPKSNRSLRGHVSCLAACQAHPRHCLTSHNSPGKRVFFVPTWQMKIRSLSRAKRSAREWGFASPVQELASCSPSSLGTKAKQVLSGQSLMRRPGAHVVPEASFSVPWSLYHIICHPPRDAIRRKRCRLVPLESFYVPSNYASLLGSHHNVNWTQSLLHAAG